MAPRQPEVDDFDQVVVLVDTENVFGLQVQVQDGLQVHVLHTLANLAHEMYAIALCQLQILVCNSIEKFTSGDIFHHEDYASCCLESIPQHQKFGVC
mmetsp:Transcript_30512/g.48812  ORF Transcript_30512/g.48812 Transcript_30512/m.48812 type:complete len:97 (-) Transcript_30512:552-842(-)